MDPITIHPESLQTRLTQRFAKILLHSQALQLTHLENLKTRLGGFGQVVSKVNPAKDQDLFIEHNIRSFTAPGDWKFEPCPTHYDTVTTLQPLCQITILTASQSDMSVEPAPKIFLQNKLTRCRTKVHELTPLLDTKSM